MHKMFLLLILLLCGCSTSSIVDPQHPSLAFNKAGEGEVTVIFESGLGNGMNSWDPVIDPISSFATTFVYDRPGYGRSRSVSVRSRTGLDSVERLRTLLARSNLEPPYVLVGHSMGGLYMQLFARLHPDEVVGVVLVDSTSVGKRSVPTPVGLPAVLKREYDGIAETIKQVEESPPFPEVPLFVLTAGSTDGSRRVAEQHMKNQRRLATLSTYSNHVVSVRSGHFVQHDDPEAVIEAVRFVVDQVENNYLLGSK